MHSLRVQVGILIVNEYSRDFGFMHLYHKLVK